MDERPAKSELEEFLSTAVPPDELQGLDDQQEPEPLHETSLPTADELAQLANLKDELLHTDQPSIQKRADVIAQAVAFVVDDEIGGAPSIINELVSLSGPVDTPLLQTVLDVHVKPVFRSNPHPSLDMETGRKLPRSAGGPMAAQDYYEAQMWKAQPQRRMINVLIWCVRHIKENEYEQVWHLVIPPTMTLLDDYETRYKLQGVNIVSYILERIPSSLLKRTGVDSLFFLSLQGCMTHLHNPSTPDLIRAAVLPHLRLIDLVTSPGSAERFSKLCALLGDGIIGSVWMYAAQDMPTIEASMEVLPDVVRALDIGSVRYLKALIPQLVHPLCSPSDLTEKKMPLARLRTVAVRALLVVMSECSVRMRGWKGTIIDGIVRCWVDVSKSRRTTPDDERLKADLREVAVQLARACPSVLANEYKVVLDTDPGLEPLLGNIGSQDVVANSE
ncbi:hypothetical protein PUNSTDRAFT_50904 [Punctularia strigosozonata HHB-11173 SS5]|uniref:uncharacterized protein n=1 Tax=Punctularia strigosozonata (strain HHB-11173) TaxID=741275 RepID=UPI00044163D8|nr:uncharacterized protein PUNSTDRAFT_50904 [Punctularia strigosozonata HHB-11173 SS5]EIN10221.1 hypothetical protein PUNSTDRAFT_50904 [Punctularia strigosozonata HHB-11173 SS5]